MKAQGLLYDCKYHPSDCLDLILIQKNVCITIFLQNNNAIY